jgi:hypothetical protein
VGIYRSLTDTQAAQFLFCEYINPNFFAVQGRTDHLIHFCQAIYALVDQLVSSRPWIVGHWWVCFPVPILYVVFNVSYWAGGGTNEVSLNQRD